MEQTLEDPVSVQQFRKEPGPWDPIRLSGDTGDAPVNRQSSDADNQTLRHPHTLQYDIRSPRYGGTRFKFVRSVWQVDQSLSPQSGYGISTSNSRGQHETQTSTSTVPKTTEASFPCLFCHPSKTLDRESRWSPKPSAGHALTPKHSLESETWSQDPLNPTNRNPTPLTATIQPFNRDIKVADVDCNYILACALLDTQCHAGNWISRRVVERLGRQDEISHDYESPSLIDAGGHEVVACGIISLQWKWSPHGTRIHECKFFVMQSPRVDVIIGADYIVSEGLLTVNEQNMLVMLRHNKASPSEKAAIALKLEEQKREKTALATQRIQSQQQAGQQQGGPSSQAQQSGQQGPTQTQGRQRP